MVVTPESYDAVLGELRGVGRAGCRCRRAESLAMEAFAYTARYDAAIARWFAEREDDFPSQYTRSFEKVLDLTYGENPHQRAAYYAETGARTHLMSMVSKLHGKELSFNNLLDLDSGRRLIEEFELPAAAIIKHNNPCGAAVGATLEDAFDSALATDPQSAFGGVFCFNRPVDRPLAEKLNAMFVEAVFAPGYDEDALPVLEQKPNVRLLENQERRTIPDHRARHQARARRDPRAGPRHGDGGARADARGHRPRSRARRSGASCCSPCACASTCARTRSCCRAGLGTVGIGAGQMSRVDSVRIAIDKAAAAGQSLDGAVLASDAFFPFADGPQLAIDAGVRAIIQPGGSQRDPEVVEACDAAGVAMVFTARRHFRH